MSPRNLRAEQEAAQLAVPAGVGTQAAMAQLFETPVRRPPFESIGHLVEAGWTYSAAELSALERAQALRYAEGESLVATAVEFRARKAAYEEAQGALERVCSALHVRPALCGIAMLDELLAANPRSLLPQIRASDEQTWGGQRNEPKE